MSIFSLRRFSVRHFRVRGGIVGQGSVGDRWARHCARLSVAGVVLIAGCGSDVVTSVRGGPDALWSTELNTVALTMAVGETFQLLVTPRTYAGDSIEGLTKRYQSGDEKLVLVSAEGSITARDFVPSYSPVPIYTFVNSPKDSLTIQDTVFVVVNYSPQTIGTFTLQPIPGDSTRQAAGIPGRGIDARAYDPDGNQISDLNIAYWTSNSRVAVTFGSYMQGVDTGNVMVYAAATAYGVTYMDSVLYRITYPITGYVNIYPRYPSYPDSDPILSGPSIRIASGGIVTWQSQSKYDVDIVFDNPAEALDPDGPDEPEPGGNIAHVQGWIGEIPGTSAQRKFLRVGRHPFHSSKYPWIQGYVEVVE